MTLVFRDSRTHRFADPATVRDPTLCSCSQESVALGVDPADHTYLVHARTLGLAYLSPNVMGAYLQVGETIQYICTDRSACC